MCAEDGMSSLFAFFSSCNETFFHYRAEVNRTASVEYKLFPIAWNSDVTQQFRRYQLSTRVPLNCSQYTPKNSGTLTLEPHLVTSCMKVFQPVFFGEVSCVDFSLILVIMTQHDHFRYRGRKRSVFVRFIGRNTFSNFFSFISMNSFVKQNGSGTIQNCSARFSPVLLGSSSTEQGSISCRSSEIVFWIWDMHHVHESVLPSAYHNPGCSTWVIWRWNLDFNQVQVSVKKYDENFENWSDHCSSWNRRKLFGIQV